MAKKRKKEKQERDGYEYKPPEFDEEEYLRKEVRDTKALLVTIIYAVLIGIASYGVMFTEVGLGVLLGIVAVVFLRHIYPLIGVDTSTLEKKQWAGNIIMYIFTWLAVWILLSNPPFADMASPTITNDEIYFENDIPGNWTLYEGDLKSYLEAGESVRIEVTIADNVEVDPDTVRIELLKGVTEITEPGGSEMFREGSTYWYNFTFDGTDVFKYTITARDVNGNEEKYTNFQGIG